MQDIQEARMGQLWESRLEGDWKVLESGKGQHGENWLVGVRQGEWETRK